MTNRDTAGNEIFSPMIRCPKNCWLTSGCDSCVPRSIYKPIVISPHESGFEVDKETEERFYQKVFKTKYL